MEDYWHSYTDRSLTNSNSRNVYWKRFTDTLQIDMATGNEDIWLNVGLSDMVNGGWYTYH